MIPPKNRDIRSYGGYVDTIGVLSFVFTLVVAGLIAATFYFVYHIHENTKDLPSQRHQPTISLRKNGNAAWTHDEITAILNRVCAAIDSDYPTNKAMKVNFDDAVLHETLKIRGNSKNIIQNTTNIHSIL